MSNLKQIRNFCIIAHIDHGKSTLADRLLEVTETVSGRQMKAQLLDQMDLERERGITIKLQPVQMNYRENGKDFIFNLIDTPGHVDFSYEVSRSLAACEGALLVVDSTQGIEAQTLANAYLAMENNLVLIPVINKIDLPNSDPTKVAAEMKSVFGFKDEEFVFASGKTGQGVDKVLEAIAKRVPSPQGDEAGPLQALIFDSSYDAHRGVIAYVRIVNGSLQPRQKIIMIGSGAESESLEVGVFKPTMTKTNQIPTGSVGYIVTGLREVVKASVGDTITLTKEPAHEPLPGYKQVRPMVYASIFPVSGDDYPLLRDAMEKLKLNDAALTFEPENIPSIGFGFRTGFLGLLHMDIVQERLTREYDLDLVLTAPSVVYEIEKTNNEVVTIYNPAGWPDPTNIKEVREPWTKAAILTPSAYIGSIMEIVTQRRGVSLGMDFVGESRVEMRFEMPLATIITDFYDKLKSVSSGYASLNYDVKENRPGNLVKLDILVAGEAVEALSAIAHRSSAESEGRALVSKLK
ncbi:MAG TPA: translation elongation factor 4, partial [Candidatus Doudnabacteria bacterium]|nr:translation elongation factor 4 [Candidatus Doudnabacteria bacterium]